MANTKSAATLILLNLAVFAFVSGNAYTCPDLNVCVNVLNLLQVQVGSQVGTPCCTLIKGILDANAFACICTKVSLLGSLLGGLPLVGNLLTGPLLDQKVLLLLNACGYNNYPITTCAL